MGCPQLSKEQDLLRCALGMSGYALAHGLAPAVTGDELLCKLAQREKRRWSISVIYLLSCEGTMTSFTFLVENRCSVVYAVKLQ